MFVARSQVQLPEKHRFPMGKYRGTHAALRADLSLRHCLNLQPVSLLRTCKQTVLPVRNLTNLLCQGRESSPQLITC